MNTTTIPTEMTIDGCAYEIIKVMTEEECSKKIFPNISEMFKRAKEIGANLGKKEADHIIYCLKSPFYPEDKIPTALLEIEAKIIFPDWRNPENPELPYYITNDLTSQHFSETWSWTCDWGVNSDCHPSNVYCHENSFLLRRKK